MLLNDLQNITAICEQVQLWVRYTRASDATGVAPVRERSHPAGRSLHGEDVSLLAHAFSKHEQFTRQAGYGILIYRSDFAHGEDDSDGDLNLKLLSVGSSIFSFSKLSSRFPTFAPLASEAAAFVDQYLISTRYRCLILRSLLQGAVRLRRSCSSEHSFNLIRIHEKVEIYHLDEGSLINCFHLYLPNVHLSLS